MLLNFLPLALLRFTPPPPPTPLQALTVPGHFDAIDFLKVHAVADSYLSKLQRVPFGAEQLQEIDQLLPTIDEQRDLVLSCPQARLLYCYASYYRVQAVEDNQHGMADLYEELMDALLLTLMSFPR